MLCQCGLDASARDFDGWTPLHAAAHWGQGEACCILAEQLCNMEARSNAVRLKSTEGWGSPSHTRGSCGFCLPHMVLQGQTPFDVADESVEKLLEELAVKQANVRHRWLFSSVGHSSLCCFLPSLSVAK